MAKYIVTQSYGCVIVTNYSGPGAPHVISMQMLIKLASKYALVLEPLQSMKSGLLMHLAYVKL